MPGSSALGTVDEVVGREGELEQLRAFLVEVARQPRALVLEGAPGIGKTTLWEAAIAAAVDRSYRVLSCRPVGGEVGLSFAALGDLLGDVLDEAVPGLPLPQRRGLEGALLLRDPEEPVVDQRAIGLAVLGVLRTLSRSEPLVVAVDDVQWLDAATAGALQFALRRLVDEPIGLLLTSRGGAGSIAGRLVGGLPERQAFCLEVRPLSVGALHRLLRGRIGPELSRPVLMRLHEASGGNPFYAIEIGRALEEAGGQLASGEPLPISLTLQELLFGRISALSPPVQDVLLTIALIAEPTLPIVTAASLKTDTVRESLAAAVAAEIIESREDQLRFSHPLLAEAVRARASVEQRRQHHARLADVVTDPEQRAWHLAHATSEPDGSVAEVLECAALSAEARGASVAAAELFERSVDLTPADRTGSRHHRMSGAARAHSWSGERQRARELLEQVIDDSTAGDGDHTTQRAVRVDALLQLLETIVIEGDDESHVLELSGRALADARDDGRNASRVHSFLARYWGMRGQNARALESGRSAVALAEESGDRDVLLVATTTLARIEIRAGEMTAGVLERALGLERKTPRPVLESPRLALAHLRLFQGRFAEARAQCEELLDKAERHGDPASAAELHAVLGHVGCCACDWEYATSHAALGRELAEQLAGENSPSAAQHMTLTALIDAHLGRIDAARGEAERAIAIARRTDTDFVARRAISVLGYVALSLGHAAEASALLLPMVEQLVARRFAIAPHPISIEPIEALIASGDVGRARPLIARYRKEARQLSSPMLLAAGDRCRGMVEAADGNLGKARAALESAREAQEQHGWTFDLARTHLAIGRVERRAQQKRAARTSLQEALDIFERLDSKPWAKQAHAELRRIGGRPPSTGQLTPTERRVATLVAEGRTNREVAATLFVTPRTVEWHLSKIYAKLGVRSRAELAHGWSDDQDAPKHR